MQPTHSSRNWEKESLLDRSLNFDKENSLDRDTSHLPNARLVTQLFSICCYPPCIQQTLPKQNDPCFQCHADDMSKVRGPLGKDPWKVWSMDAIRSRPFRWLTCVC